MNISSAKLREKYNHYVMGTYPVSEIALVRGEGCRVWDAEGREYLDFASGISVCNLGHCHPRVTRAIIEQAGKLVHVSNLFMNEMQPLLAEKLIRQTFDGVCFFANSGAEANEGLIKFARKWGHAQGLNEIIVMDESFHGRTLATLAATGRQKYRQGFGPDMAGFTHVPYNDLKAVENAVTNRTAAVLLEAVQGEGGILPADPDYIRGLRALCDRLGILLMFDEVQCGMGRTGKLWAWQHYDIEPDAFSAAKAIANGLPMGCFMVKRAYEKVLTPGTHASTFGGTPLVSAAAIAVLDTIVDENLLNNATRMGEYLRAKLHEMKSEFPFIREVRGAGLMIGIVLDRPAAPLLSSFRDAGILVLSAGETVLRLLPPLIITPADAERALVLIKTVFAGMPAESHSYPRG